MLNRFTLWVILASATLTVMAGATLGPVVNLVREGLGIDPASVGFIVTTHALFVALFSPLAGSIIDRIGTKKPFMFGLVLYGLSGGSGLFIDSYWPLIVSRALLGIAVAATMNCTAVMILNLYQGAERNKVMGWRSSANNFGSVIFPLIGGGLGSISWHMPFAIYLVGIPLAFLTLITIPQTRHEKKQDQGKEGSVFKVFKNNYILFGICGLQFLTMVFLYINVVFLPQLLETVGIADPFYISLFFMAVWLPAGLTSLMYGRIKTRLSYKMIVLTALALWTVAFAAIYQAPSVLIIAVSVVLIGIGQGLIMPTFPVWAGEIVPASFHGRIISYLSTIAHLGCFSSPILFGPVSSMLGFNGVYLVAGIICVLVFLLSLALMRK